MAKDVITLNASELLAGTAIRMEDWQPQALGAPALEFQQLAVEIEQLQPLSAEIQSSHIAPVAPTPQTHEMFKTELILDDELPIQASHSQKHKPDIPEKADYQQAAISTAEEGSEMYEHSPISLPEVLVETQTDASFKCTSCRKLVRNCSEILATRLFRTAQHLRLHIVTHSKDRRPEFPCQLCGRVCYNKGSLKTHMKSHTGDTHKGAATVQGSQERAAAVDDKQRTTVNIEATDIEICKVCHKSYRKESMKSHMRLKHIDRPYKCELCPKTFQRRQELINHLQKHGKGEFCCHLCPKTFFTRTRLTQHKALHTGDTFNCKVCSGRYLTQAALKTHMLQMHPGDSSTNVILPKKREKLHKCEVCLRSFAEKSNLRRHMTRHTEYGKLEFACHLCPRKLSSQAILQQHIRLHTGDLFNCKICNKRYATITRLNDHMRRKHSTRTLSNSRQLKIRRKKEFACHLCSKKLSTDKSLQLHLRLHTGDTINCKMCSSRYTTMSNLNAHMRQKHSSETQQLTDGALTLNEASVDMKTEFISDEEFLDEAKASDSAQGRRKRELAVEEQQLTSVIKAYNASVHPEDKQNEISTPLTSDDVSVHFDGKHPHTSGLQTSNDASVHKYEYTELVSVEEFLDKDKGADSVQGSQERAVGVDDDQTTRVKIEANDEESSELHPKSYPKESITSHMRLEPSERPYKCDVCPLSFTNEQILREHMATHAKQGKPEFSCHLCSKKLSTYVSLQQHIRSHTGDTVNCKVCGARYTTLSNLKAHMRQKHSSETQQLTSGPLPPNDTSADVSVDTYTVFILDEEVLDEAKRSDSAEGSRKSDPSVEDEQTASVSITYSASVQSEHKHQENFPPLTTDDVSVHPKKKDPHNTVLQTSNHGSVDTKANTMSDEGFLKKGSYPHSAQGSQVNNDRKVHASTMYDGQLDGSDFVPRQHFDEAQHSVQEPQTINVDSVETNTQLASEEEFLAEVVGAESPEESHQSYKCEFCPRLFTRKSWLTRHLRTHGKERKREFVCPVCGDAFYTKGTLTIHLQIHSDGNYKCTLCGAQFRQKSYLIGHMFRRHMDEEWKIYPDFQRATNLTVQLNTDAALLTEAAAVCAQESNQSAVQLTDEERVISVKPNETGEFSCNINPKESQQACERRYECESCPRSFTTTVHLRQHMATHAKDRRPEFICQSCGKGCYSKGSLKTHMKTHTGDTHKGPESVLEHAVAVDDETRTSLNNEATDAVSCKLCHESCPKESINSHMRQKHMDRPYKCEFCPRSFKIRQSLKEHLSKHAEHGKRENVCHLCLKAFSTHKSLQEHIRLHERDTFNCKVCGARYTAKSTLKKHMLRKHSERTQAFTSGSHTANEVSVQSNAVVTSDEDSTQASQDTANEQNGACQPTSDAYNCQVCEARFTQQGSLKMHMLSQHSVEKIQPTLQDSQTPNADGVDIKEECISDEEFIDEEAAADAQ